MRKNLFLLFAATTWLAVWWYWPHINFFIGNYKYNNYYYTDAIEAYSKSIRAKHVSDTLLGKSYFSRAKSKLNLAFATRGSDEDIYDALQDYNTAINLIPNNPYYYRERGTALSYLGAYEEAFDDFELVGELEGEPPLWSLVRKGGLQKRLGNYDQAIAIFEEVIAAWAPTSVMPPNYHLTLTYMELNEYEKALAAITEGLNAQTDYGPAYQIKGCIEANLGLFKEALTDYEKGVLLKQSFRDETSLTYPSWAHDEKIEQKETDYLRALAQGTEKANAGQLKQLCSQSWWRLHFDKKRNRSRLL